MNIDIETGGVQSTVSSFQGQVNELEGKFEEIMAKTNAVRGNWEGDEADATLAQIEKFQTLFEAVRKKNEGYIQFMNATAAAYETEDNNTSSAANSLSD